MESTEKSYEAARRSTRIQAQIPLRLTSLDPAIQMSEHCHTLVLNTQGCGVRLDELPGGQSVTARVANCVPLGPGGKSWVVGVALDQTGNIWGIHPAPVDWGSEPQPVAAAVAIPREKNEWPYSQFSTRGEFHPGRK